MHQRHKYNLVQYRPEPLAIHSHIVRWRENGFVIEKRCYCAGAAQFEAEFMRRMWKADVEAVRVRQ